MLHRLSYLFFFLLLSSSIWGSDYYWVGGNGDWSDINHWATSSGGNVKHIQTPTANDNVYFDQNSSSGALSVNMTHPVSFCKDLNFSGLTQTLELFGVCNEIKIYGSLNLSNLVTWSLSTLTLSFESQQAGNTITSNSCSIPGHIQFSGQNGSWSLTDSLFSIYDIIHNAGTFYTNNKNIRFNQYISQSTLNRNWNLGSSQIFLKRVDVANSGFSCTPGTSHIHFTGSTFQVINISSTVYFYDLTFYNSASLGNSTLQFHNVTFRTDGQINGTITYNILHLTKNSTYIIGGMHEIITDLEADGGCNQMIEIIGPHTFTKSSGTINISFVKLKASIALGGANWHAYDSYDLGNNSGWNIHPFTPRTLYWVGGSGTWIDSTHWSLSSGGPGGECYPEIIDNVVFDNNSFNWGDSVIIDQLDPAKCHDMTWNNTLQAKFKGDINQILLISGSLDFSPHIDLAYKGDTRFVSSDTGEHVKTANLQWPNRVVFDGKGSWHQLDQLNITKEYKLDEGTFYTNGNPITCSNFILETFHEKNLYLSNSHIHVEVYLYINQDSTSIFRGTSTFHIYSDQHGVLAINLPRQKLWNVIMENTDSTKYPEVLISELEIHKLVFKGNGLKRGSLKVDTMIFATGNDFLWRGHDTITQHLRCSGYCSKTTTWRAIEPVEIAHITKTSGTLQIDHTNLRGIYAHGNATFIAQNSSDVGMNDGWIFLNPGTELYWVGNSGNWHDSLNWSYSSGGPGGACIPTIADTVYFDQNSFSSASQNVEITNHTAFCRDMMWSSGLPMPNLISSNNTTLYIAGNVEMSEQMDVANFGDIFFCDTTQNKYILSRGSKFNKHIAFIDYGEWSFADSFNILTGIVLIKGSLSTNGHKVTIGVNFTGDSPFTKQLDISNSEVVFPKSPGLALFYWNHCNPNCQFTATNSHVRFYNSDNIIHLFGSGQVDFHNVYFEDDYGISHFKSNPKISNTNNYVIFRNSGIIYGTHTYDSLIFSAGNTYTLKPNTTQFIGSYFQAVGYCTQTINISGSPGSSFIHKNSSPVNIHKVNLMGVTAQGKAIFNSIGGQDLGNNVNWNFYPDSARILYWVEGSGNWNDTVHWSLQSGGIGGECPPTRIDKVFVDQNSFTGNQLDIQTKAGDECFDLHWKNNNQGKLSGLLSIYGGLMIIPGVDLLGQEFRFMTEKMGNKLQTGNNLIGKARFLGSGEWLMKDSLWVVDTLNYLGGYLNTQGNDIIAHTFYSGQSLHKKGLTLGNSDIRLRYMWKMNSDSLAFLNAGTSTIYFENGTVNYKFIHYKKNAAHYSNVVCHEEMKKKTEFYNLDTADVFFNRVEIFNNGDFFNRYTFDSLIFSPGNTYRFQDGMTQEILDYWLIRGNNCYPINLESTDKFQTAFVHKDTGTVSGDFILMRDIHALGGCTYYAGAFSTDISNNSGWIFQNGPNYVYGLGPDTAFSLGSSIVLHTTNFNGNSSTLYQWNTGSTTDTIVVKKAGMYWVTVTYANNCQIIDTIWVGCDVNLQYNVTDAWCFGDTNGVISAIIPDSSYSYQFYWSTGDTSSTIQPYPAGYYALKLVTDSGYCVLFDTVEIKQPPELFIPQGDTSFCQDDSVRLNVGPFTKFYWADGYPNQFRWVSQPDTFYLYVEDYKGCKSAPDTIVVLEDLRPTVFLGMDTTVCLNEELLLSPGYGFDAYFWYNGNTDSVDIIYYPGEYWVEIWAKACHMYDTILVEPCPPLLEYPNIFTPNNDGYNDRFLPILADNIYYAKIKIFNRHGMRIYMSEDIFEGWDGQYLGQLVPEGVYFFTVEYKEWMGREAGTMKYQQGHVRVLYNSR